jgi:uncharacterized membrane protein YjgN (DUF898 family)
MEPHKMDDVNPQPSPQGQKTATNTPISGTTPDWRRVIFHGTGSEFFRIWIVNLLLTLLTLGIYSAWATVRERRYLYGNTEVAGSRFDFHGKPLQILLGRIIAIILLLAWTQGHYIHASVQYIAIGIVLVLFPWFLVRAMTFRMRNTSLRNLRFNFKGATRPAYKIFGIYLILNAILIGGMLWSATSAFGGIDPESMKNAENLEAMGRFMGMYMLIMLAFAFLYPAFLCDMRAFTANNTLYGNQAFSINLKRTDFINHFWIAIGISMAASMLAIIALALAAGVIALAMFGLGQVIDFSALGIKDSAAVVAIFVGLFAVYFLIGLSYLVAYAYWQIKVFNLTFNNLTLGAVNFRSDMHFIPLSKILLVNALLVIFTLGFAYPWARIRVLRYQLQAVEYQGDETKFEGQPMHANSAIGDEVGDAFDLDFGF